MNTYLSKYRKNLVKKLLAAGVGLEDIAAKTGLNMEQLKKATTPILPKPNKWWRKTRDYTKQNKPKKQ